MGYPNATYKSFTSYEEAKSFIYGSDQKENTKVDFNAEITAYIDGSYNDKQNLYSYAYVVFHKNQKLTFAAAEDDLDILDQRNVAGEIKAAISVIEFAMKKDANSLEIIYDYAGVEKWAKNEWKAKNPFTQSYVKFVQSVGSKIDIKFTKVKSHSGNKYNDEVDLLAKEVFRVPEKIIEKIYDIESKETGNEIETISERFIDYTDTFNLLNGTKRSISLGLIMGNDVYSSKDIFEAFKNKWRKYNRKLNELTEIKAAFDCEKKSIIIFVLSNKGEKEIVELRKEEIKFNDQE